MGQLHYYVGVCIVLDKENKQVFLHQGQYIKKMLKKFGQTAEAKPVSTPADLNVKLQKEDGVSRPVDAISYQSIVGSLLYAAIATRPDIAQAVGVVSKFCTNPTQSHFTAAKRILRYLKLRQLKAWLFIRKRPPAKILRNLYSLLIKVLTLLHEILATL